MESLFKTMMKTDNDEKIKHKKKGKKIKNWEKNSFVHKVNLYNK